MSTGALGSVVAMPSSSRSFLAALDRAVVIRSDDSRPNPLQLEAQHLFDVGDLGAKMGRMRADQAHLLRQLLPAVRELRLDELPVQVGDARGGTPGGAGTGIGHLDALHDAPRRCAWGRPD